MTSLKNLDFVAFITYNDYGTRTTIYFPTIIAVGDLSVLRQPAENVSATNFVANDVRDKYTYASCVFAFYIIRCQTYHIGMPQKR
jgi:hypothetical protein